MRVLQFPSNQLDSSLQAVERTSLNHRVIFLGGKFQDRAHRFCSGGFLVFCYILLLGDGGG
jgi:hypothetical protein